MATLHPMIEMAQFWALNPKIIAPKAKTPLKKVEDDVHMPTIVFQARVLPPKSQHPMYLSTPNLIL